MANAIPTPVAVTFNSGEPLDADKLNIIQDNIQQLTSAQALINQSIDGTASKVTSSYTDITVKKDTLNSKTVTIPNTADVQVFLQPQMPTGASKLLKMSTAYELSGQSLKIYVLSNEDSGSVRVDYMIVEKITK
jgi:hypothetical protein